MFKDFLGMIVHFSEPRLHALKNGDQEVSIYVHILELGGIIILILVSINLIMAYIPVYSELLTQSPPFQTTLSQQFI